MLPSKNTSLLAQRDASGITRSSCPVESRYALLASPSLPLQKGGKHTNGIICRAGTQNTKLHILKVSAVTAETRDVGACTGAVDQVVSEACLCAGREAAEVDLCEGGGGSEAEEGEDGWELHLGVGFCE